MQTETRLAISLTFALLAAGCASQANPGGGREACPSGLTVYCETYHGKPQRCFCASRDDLKDVLEPRQEPY